MEARALRGLAVFRWAAWVWVAVVAGVDHDRLQRQWLAYALVALALGVTIWQTALLRTRTTVPVTATMFEFAIAIALSIGGGFAYRSGGAFPRIVTLGSPWTATGVLMLGVGFGPLVGGGAGLMIGAARAGAAFANAQHAFGSTEILSLAHTAVIFALPGLVAGMAMVMIRRAEREISAARTRDELAQRLHDGVLQALAIIERRTGDPVIERLAREQERELREYLFGRGPRAEQGGAKEIGPALRAVAARFEDAFDGRAEVVLAPDLPPLDADEVEALTGAVGESLMNAGRHGRARHVVVYAEPAHADGVACSVKDDGAGFDTTAVEEGVGIQQSIRARLAAVGGRAEVESQPGAGTEVRMWLH